MLGVQVGLTQFLEEPGEDVSEARRFLDPLEIAARLGRDLFRNDAIAEGWQPFGAVVVRGGVRKGPSQFAHRAELDVDQPAVQFCESPAQIGTQEGAADQDGERRERG